MCNGFTIFWKQTQDFKVLKMSFDFSVKSMIRIYVNIFSIGSFYPIAFVTAWFYECFEDVQYWL